MKVGRSLDLDIHTYIQQHDLYLWGVNDSDQVTVQRHKVLVLSGYMSTTQFLVYRITRREQQKITNQDFANNLRSSFLYVNVNYQKLKNILAQSSIPLSVVCIYRYIVHIPEYQTKVEFLTSVNPLQLFLFSVVLIATEQHSSMLVADDQQMSTKLLNYIIF